MLMMNANCFALRATSAMRSVPLQCVVEVSATSAPQLKAASAMRMSSVATITESSFFALLHRSHTRCRRALPAIRCNGFPGKRVELQRAGMMPTALFMAVILSEAKRSARNPSRVNSGSAAEFLDSARNDGGSPFSVQDDLDRCGQIVGHPICVASWQVAVKSGPHTNRTYTRVVGAFDVDLLVANQEGTGKFDLMVSRGFYNHSGRGLTALRMLSGRMRTVVSGVNQTVAKLSSPLRFDRAI